MTRVFSEFVASDYGRRTCDECNVQPMIGSPNVIGVMFESVRVDGPSKLVIKLNQVFETRHEKILEQLVRHLRGRLPGLKMLQYENKSPPSTRTIPI